MDWETFELLWCLGVAIAVLIALAVRKRKKKKIFAEFRMPSMRYTNGRCNNRRAFKENPLQCKNLLRRFYGRTSCVGMPELRISHRI